jgi:ribosomal protein L7/L12
MEYYLVAILVLVFYLVILVSKNGRIRDKKTTGSDRQLEEIHQLLAEIKANQQSGLNYLKDTFQLARIEQKLDILLQEFDIKNNNNNSSYPIQNQTEFDVMLNAVPVDKKIAILKEVRMITGLGLREAKELIESRLPVVVQEKRSAAEAEKAKNLLQEAGADVFLR